MGIALDQSTIARATSGDREAMDELLRAARPHVERQLLRYPVTEEDRKDLLQSALTQVARRLSSFRGDSSFSTWLFRVTANEALMMMRAERRRRARVTSGYDFDDLAGLAAESATERDDAAFDSRDTEEIVRRALGSLKDADREVVEAHYHRDLGLHEIADQLKITESAVRSRLHRARLRLRNLLEQARARAALPTVGIDAAIRGATFAVPSYQSAA